MITKDLNGLDILIVSNSSQFGMSERTILRDIKSLIERGHKVNFVCLKDSHLDINSRGIDLEKKYLDEFSIGRLPKLLSLSQQIDSLIKKKNIQIVHIYSSSLICPIAFGVRKYPHVPLVLSIYEKLNKKFNNFFYRSFVERIDLAFAPIEILKEHITSHLSLPVHKIFSLPPKTDEKNNNHPIEFIEGPFKLGIVLNGDEEDFRQFKFLLRSFKRLQDKLSNRRCILKIYNRTSWNSYYLNHRLREAIYKYKLEESVQLLQEKHLVTTKIDILVSFSNEYLLDSTILTSLIYEIPFLAVRSEGVMEVLDEFGEVGLSYRHEDVREFCSKILKILESYPDYIHNISFLKYKLGEISSPDFEKELVTPYKKAISKRKNFLDRKKKFYTNK